MVSERLTTMPADEFDELLKDFIERETKEMGELDASLFYAAIEDIYAAESEPTTVELQAQVVGSELHLHLPTATPTKIDVHNNVISVNDLRFVIHLMPADSAAA